MVSFESMHREFFQMSDLIRLIPSSVKLLFVRVRRSAMEFRTAAELLEHLVTCMRLRRSFNGLWLIVGEISEFRATLCSPTEPCIMNLFSRFLSRDHWKTPRDLLQGLQLRDMRCAVV